MEIILIFEVEQKIAISETKNKGVNFYRNLFKSEKTI